VQNDRDYSEDQKDVDQESSSVEGEKTACPKYNENQSDNQPHRKSPYKKE
jgi:hypothetical protein